MNAWINIKSDIHHQTHFDWIEKADLPDMLTGSIDREKHAKNNVNNNLISIDPDNKSACKMTSKQKQSFVE